MARCAYCGRLGPLTREHIWPKWLHDSGDYSLKFHAAADKVLPAEQVIKDVCAECNSGPLSALDDYVSSLHDTFFGEGYQKIKDATFRYDFERLTKWLLKVSYNSARASNAPDVELLGRYGPCIVAQNCSPIFAAFSVSLLGQLIEVDRDSGARKAIELLWCRAGPVALSAPQSEVMSVRTIMINTWCFMVVVMRDGKLRNGEASLVLPMLRGAIIRPDRALTKVPTVPLDADGVLQHYRDKRHLYDAASSRRRT